MMLGPYKTLEHSAEIMAKVASLYYYDGLTQAEIANSLNISRIKVSRL